MAENNLLNKTPDILSYKEPNEKDLDEKFEENQYILYITLNIKSRGIMYENGCCNNCLTFKMHSLKYDIETKYS